MGSGCCRAPPVATCMTVTAGGSGEAATAVLQSTCQSLRQTYNQENGAHENQGHTSTITDDECESRGWMKTQNTS
jgi:hypothetical protein